MAEFLLYGRTEYEEVIRFAASLREAAEKQGTIRGIAFAVVVGGEALLLSGNIDAAVPMLEEAIVLHRQIGANAGESLSLQRLAEAHMYLGNRETAMQLLEESLPLARWSLLSHHLLQRIFGTMIRLADDSQSAMATVQRAEKAIGPADMCPFCTVMIAVPAAIACAGAGEIEAAQFHAMIAQASCEHWPGTAWQGAVAEANAHIAAAQGNSAEAADLFEEAALLYERAGQPLDAERCRAGVPERELRTILFSDLVASTERASSLGDTEWRELLDQHDALVRAAIARGGREIKHTGDGFLATFASPGQAIAGGRAIVEGLRPLGIDARVGVHTGEVEVRGEDIGGIAVHIASRVMHLAGPGQVAVSHVVPPLVAGSGTEFTSDGEHRLKGVDGAWEIFHLQPAGG